MRHTFASAYLEDALGRTAGELIEGEMGVLKALGRFFEECRERGVVGGVGVGTVAAAAAAAGRPEENEVEENEVSSSSAQVPAAGRAEEGGENGQMPMTMTMMDGVLQQSQEAPPHPPSPQDPNNPYAPPPPPPPPAHLHQPHLSPLEQLFITPGGLQITLPPNAAAPPQATTEDGLPVGGGPGGGGVLTLSVEHQKEALYRGMDALVRSVSESFSLSLALSLLERETIVFPLGFFSPPPPPTPSSLSHARATLIVILLSPLPTVPFSSSAPGSS
jgi:hypothetical protein